MRNDNMESEDDVVGSGIVPRTTSETRNDYLENDDCENVDDDIENTKNSSSTANNLFCNRTVAYNNCIYAACVHDIVHIIAAPCASRSCWRRGQ